MEKLSLISSVFLVFLFNSCTFSYEAYSTNLEKSKNSPSIQIINIRYYDIANNKEQTILSSEAFNYFNKERVYKLSNGSFFYRALHNDIRGKFDKLNGSQVTKNLDMQDNVEMRMYHEDRHYVLNTNRLLWKNDLKELEAPSNEIVLIQFDGNEIKGKNFSYFFKTNTYYFYSGVEGNVK